MDRSVTVGTERYQIFLGICPEVTSGLFVMHLKGVCASTRLTPPAITAQNTLAQFTILL